MATSLSKLYGAFADRVDINVLQIVHHDDEALIDPCGEQGGALARLNVKTGDLFWRRAAADGRAGGNVAHGSSVAADFFHLVIDHRLSGIGVPRSAELWASELAELRQIHRMLRDDGVYARAIPHRNRVLAPVLQRLGLGSKTWSGHLPALKMQAELAATAQFKVLSSFYLYPSAANPNWMVAADRRNAERFFQRIVKNEKNRVSRLGYVVRRALVFFNLYRWLMDAELVWMRKS